MRNRCFLPIVMRGFRPEVLLGFSLLSTTAMSGTVTISPIHEQEKAPDTRQLRLLGRERCPFPATVFAPS